MKANKPYKFIYTRINHNFKCPPFIKWLLSHKIIKQPNFQRNIWENLFIL